MMTIRMIIAHTHAHTQTHTRTHTQRLVGQFTCDFWACVQCVLCVRSSSSSFLPRFYLFFALLLLLLSPLFLAHFISYFAFATRAHSLVLQNIFHRFFIHTKQQQQRRVLFKFSGIFFFKFPFLGFSPLQRERNTNKNNNREQPPLSCKRERIETRHTHTRTHKKKK